MGTASTVQPKREHFTVVYILGFTLEVLPLNLCNDFWEALCVAAGFEELHVVPAVPLGAVIVVEAMADVEQHVGLRASKESVRERLADGVL